MKRGLAIGLILLVLGAGFWGCLKAKEEPKGTEKSAARPPIAVEATQVRVGDLMEGIDVVGSLAAKFGGDVKSEYPGIVTDCLCERMGPGEKRDSPGKDRYP